MWEALGDYHGPPTFTVFTRYLTARFNREMTERLYRAYVTDSLMLMPQMSYLPHRWYDVACGKEQKDDRTAEEIVDDVISRI